MKEEFRQNSMLTGMADVLLDSGDNINVQNFNLPSGIDNLSSKMRLSVKSRGTLDRHEREISEQVKSLVGQWKEIKEVQKEKEMSD